MGVTMIFLVLVLEGGIADPAAGKESIFNRRV
jgi:hypothetical protein